MIKTTIKPTAYCFVIDQSVFHSPSVQLGLQAWTWA